MTSLAQLPDVANFARFPPATRGGPGPLRCPLACRGRYPELREVPATDQAIRPARPSATGADHAMTPVQGRLP